MPSHLLRLDDFDRAESRKWPVDEEDLHGDVGLDVRLGEKGNDPATGELFDGVAVSLGHHVLELLSHRYDPGRLAAVHDRLLQRGEAAAPHDDDDDVV